MVFSIVGHELGSDNKKQINSIIHSAASTLVQIKTRSVTCNLHTVSVAEVIWALAMYSFFYPKTIFEKNIIIFAYLR